MLEFLKLDDMKEIQRKTEGIFTAYRIFYKKSELKKKRNYPILLLWTTYLRAWALHTTKETSLVNLFTQNGFDVYLVDWGDDSYFLPRGGSFEDYIQYSLDIFDYVLQQSKKEKLHYFGVCEGSVLAEITASLRADYIKSLSFNDLILNSDNMGVTNLLMDYFLVPFTDNPMMRFFASFFNLDSNQNAYFLNHSLYSNIGIQLMNHRLIKETPMNQLFWLMVWTAIDTREIEFYHHIDYAKIVYSNAIFKGEFEPNLSKEGKVKIKLSNIHAPIFNIIGGTDNFTEPAASFIEQEENPFGTTYEEILQEVIPSGHNFWLITENTDKIREKWITWVIKND